MSLLLTDGFEDGNYTSNPTWSASGTVSVQSSIKYAGTYAAQIANGSSLITSIVGEISDFSFWVYQSSIVAGTAVYVGESANFYTNNILMFAYSYAGDKHHYKINNAGSNIELCAASAGTWYKYRLVLNKVADTLSIYVYNTSLSLLGSAIDVAVGDVSLYDEIQLKNIGNSGTSAYFDNIDYGEINIKEFSVDSILLKISTKTFTTDVLLKKIKNTKTFITDAILVNRNTKQFSIDSILVNRNIKTFSIDAHIINPVTLIEPIDDVEESSPVYLVFESTTEGTSKKHFRLQVDDTSSAFGSLELDLDTQISITNWEYDSTGSGNWVTFPSSGLDVAYFGNDVRYNATLTASDKWWRVRELILQ